MEVEVRKETMKHHYDTKPNEHYCMGYSRDDHQLFQSSLIYPKVFDGVIAGDLKVDWLEVVASKACSRELDSRVSSRKSMSGGNNGTPLSNTESRFWIQ